MINQFGQDIKVGSIVGHSYRTGSYTTRHVGVVRELTDKADGYDYRTRKTRRVPAIKVQWFSTGKTSTVFTNAVFALDPATVTAYKSIES